MTLGTDAEVWTHHRLMQWQSSIPSAARGKHRACIDNAGDTYLEAAISDITLTPQNLSWPFNKGTHGTKYVLNTAGLQGECRQKV